MRSVFLDILDDLMQPTVEFLSNDSNSIDEPAILYDSIQAALYFLFRKNHWWMQKMK
jgi:hypothetical protein